MLGALDPPFPGLVPQHGLGPGVIWGFDLRQGLASQVHDCDQPHPGRLRWLHFSLSNHGTRRWIEEQSGLPPQVRELLLSAETHQRALVEDGAIGCVLHDFERDFDVADTKRMGALRVAMTADLVVTARLHPMRCADDIKQKLQGGAIVSGPAQALDLIITVIGQNVASLSRSLSTQVQTAEDALIEGRPSPSARELIALRRRLAQVHRMLEGMRGVVQRLEEDNELPPEVHPTAEKLAQRLQSLDADVMGVLRELRQLRDEIEAQAAQRTNQNLYILSIISALLLPATVVTGIFGMNTGGMLLTDNAHGTFLALLLAAGSAAATYLWLRWLGFMRQ